MVYKTKTGEKLYPICSWENNQHKLYNAHDRIMNAIYESKENGQNVENLWNSLNELEDIMGKFDAGVKNDGLVYATWEDGKKIKEYIMAYNVRHDQILAENL